MLKGLTGKLAAGLFAALVMLSGLVLAQMAGLQTCLPPGVQLSDIVDAQLITWYRDGRPPLVRKTSVQQKLAELKAYCESNNKLVDSSGKEIRFYRLTGCWGNPPYFYREILKRQQDEIDKLKLRYTVIEMTCNPSGIPIA